MILKINKIQAGIRIDKFIHSKFIYSNITDIRKFIRKKDIYVNKLKVTTDYLLNKGDNIFFSDFVEKILLNPINYKNPIEKINSTHNKLILDNIIYEDANLIVINKPYGLSVQGGTGVKISVDDILKNLSNNRQNLKLIHRLDQYTTGVLIIAKNIETANELKRIFKEKKEIKKEYLAIVIGKVKNKEGIIDYHLIKKYENNIEKVYVDKVNGKEAITKYKTLAYSDKQNLSLVRIEILTGRTHQIRVHFKEIGNPILGDFKYGRKNQNNIYNNHNLQLHSYRTTLMFDSRKYIFKAKIPKHIKTVLKNGFFKKF